MIFSRSAMGMARLVSSILLAAATAFSAAASAEPADHAAIEKAYGQLPITFERNIGQARSRYEYVSHGPRFRLMLDRDSAVLLLAPPGGSDQKSPVQPRPISLRFVGASKDGSLEGEDELETKTNYLWGSSGSDQITNVPNFGAVRRTGLYDGIDVRYYGDRRQLEYDFIVSPGADPAAIRLRFDGLKSLATNRAGDLVLRTPSGELIQKRPFAYQLVDGEKKAVQVRYRKTGSTVRLVLGTYDRSRALVIDPVLSYSTYLGDLPPGFSTDLIRNLRVDLT